MNRRAMDYLIDLWRGSGVPAAERHALKLERHRTARFGRREPTAVVASPNRKEQHDGV